MRILRLKLQNYRRHRDVEMEFPDGVIAIVGNNGSGKTSLLEAIAFALYGTQATRTAKALLRSDHAPPGDPVRVEMDAELAGQAITIIRELRGSNQTGVATLIVDGHTIVAPQAGSFEAATAEISKRLGLDRDTFFTTVFAQQKDLARLADKSKAERKKMVLDMLGINALDQAIQEARTLRRTSEASVQTLQAQVARYADVLTDVEATKQSVDAAMAEQAARQVAWEKAQEQLAAAQTTHNGLAANASRFAQAEAAHRQAEQDVQHLTRNQGSLEQRIAAATEAGVAMANHEHEAATLPDLRAAYEAALKAAGDQAHRRQLEQRLQALEKELAELVVPDAPNGVLSRAQEQVMVAAKAHGESRERLAVASAEARGLKDRLRRITSIGDAPCPVCERPMEGVDLRTHLEAELDSKGQLAIEAQILVQEREAALEASRKSEAEALAAQRRHEQAAARQQELLRAITPLRADLAKMADVVASDPDALRPALQAAEHAHTQMLRLQAAAQTLPALQREAADLQARLAIAQQRLEDALSETKSVQHDPAALSAAQAALQAATMAERAAERAATQAAQAVALSKVAAQQAAKRAEESARLKGDLDAATKQHRLYEALAGGRGAGLFERFRNHLVGRIGPAVAAEASHLLSRFTGGRYTEVILDDEYDIYVTDEGARYHLDRFSGGEADLVHLALRLAVSRLLLERSGAEIRFLALDEVFGSLDGERRRLVLGALQELGSLYSQVFLVTHHEEMREMLDHTLLVEEGPDGATVRMHNL